MAQVTVCGQVFTSSVVRTKKVDAEQDAAKLAFEYFQQQKTDDTSAAGKDEITTVPCSVTLWPTYKVFLEDCRLIQTHFHDHPPVAPLQAPWPPHNCQ